MVQQARLLNSFLLLGLLVFGGCANHEAERSNPVIPSRWDDLNHYSFSRNQGFLIKADSLYSGYAFTLLDSDTTLMEPYYRGKLEGEARYYYPNGQLREQRWFEKGKKEGTHYGWWENGNKRFEREYDNGLYEGSVKEWYRSGQLARHFHYHQGQESGSQKMWKSDGRIKANYVVKEGKRFGKTPIKNCTTVLDEEVDSSATDSVVGL